MNSLMDVQFFKIQFFEKTIRKTIRKVCVVVCVFMVYNHHSHYGVEWHQCVIQ